MAGAGASAGCALQQWLHCIMAGELQSPMDIPRQHEGRAMGLKQASAGVAIQRTTSVSSTNALFLPTSIV